MNDREVLKKFDELCRESKDAVADFKDRDVLEGLLREFLELAGPVRETLVQEANFEQSREDTRDLRWGGTRF